MSVPAQPEEGLGSFGGRLGASVTARVSHTQVYLFGPLQGVGGLDTAPSSWSHEKLSP